MIFSSYAFVFLFMPFTLFYYRYLLYLRSRDITSWFLFLSLLFYSYWDWKNLFIIIPSICFNFYMGKYIENAESSIEKKYLLYLSVGLNLLLLAYFKYSGFFLTELSSLLNVEINFQAPELPLGISFFTFTQIAYLVDLYKNKTKGSSFVSYSLFVTYFPHLIAGPLLHHKAMIQQFNGPMDIRKFLDGLALGVTIFIIGLFKKVVIADYFGEYADEVFNLPHDKLEGVGSIQAWRSALSYTFQLYFDFSGYSDMAIGISRGLGIALPINFNSPYKASSIAEFWRRWHVTLSTFLRDYLYIPLGGSRKGNSVKLVNLMIVMILCGVWHGAGYTFAVWGAYHGCLLVLYDIWSKHKPRFHYSSKIIKFITALFSMLITFLMVVIGWVIFRSHAISDAETLFQAMIFIKDNSLPDLKPILFEFYYLLLAFVFVALFPNTQEVCGIDKDGNVNNIWARWWNWRPNLIWSFILSFMFLISLFNMNKVSPFLYFQF